MSAYSAPEGGHEGRYARFVNRGFDRLSDAYGRALEVILHLRAQIIAFGVFVCLLAVPLYMFSSQELAPIEDEGFILLIVNSAPDASLAYTSGHMDKVLNIGKTLPEYEAMFEIVFPSTGLRRVPPQELARPRAHRARDPAGDLRCRLEDQGAADLPGPAPCASWRRQL